MELEELKKLIKLVEKSQISEIEIEEDGKKVRITKPSAQQQATAATIHQTIPVAAPVAVPAAPTAIEKTKPKETSDNANYHLVKSPMVGTFYRAPSADAEPFVNIGDVVGKGQTLCIIEAMKLMNEIESDIKGKIVDILPENGGPAEFGEVLFKIEPV